MVVLTTRAGDKHVGVARQLGVSHYMAKPVDEQAFVQLIESLAVTRRERQAREPVRFQAAESDPCRSR